MSTQTAQTAQIAQTAQTAQPTAYIGVDVAKAELVIAHQEPAQKSQVHSLPNQKGALKRWLKTLPAACAIALEATSTYHQLLSDLAYAAGHQVYVLNPKQLKHYRSATGARAKTDICDALLIARYLQREQAHLHPYTPLCATAKKLCALVRRRAAIVKSKTLLKLSLQEQASELALQSQFNSLLQGYARLLKAIDQKIAQLLKHPDYADAAQRLQSIVGIGPLSAAALLVALERGEFQTPEALVAFLGLDPTPRESGQSCGRRRLSKQGDSETRRLLFNAARSASQTDLWAPYSQRYLQRGLSSIQTHCILARKMVRIAWSLHKHQTFFCPEKFAQTLT